MDIIKKVTKEVEEVIGHKCDSCGTEIELCLSSIDLNLVKYSFPKGCYGHEETKTQHFCSFGCLQKLLIDVPYNATIYLSCDIIRKLKKRLRGYE